MKSHGTLRQSYYSISFHGLKPTSSNVLSELLVGRYIKVYSERVTTVIIMQ